MKLLKVKDRQKGTFSAYPSAKLGIPGISNKHRESILFPGACDVARIIEMPVYARLIETHHGKNFVVDTGPARGNRHIVAHILPVIPRRQLSVDRLNNLGPD